MTVTTMSSAVVCRYDALLPERGVAALLGDVQIALFRTHDGLVFALGNQDPFSGANVLSRGIVGSRGEVPTVASPMFKQAFDLRTGVCLDDPGVSVPAYRVEIVDDQIVVSGTIPTDFADNATISTDCVVDGMVSTDCVVDGMVSTDCVVDGMVSTDCVVDGMVSTDCVDGTTSTDVVR